MSGENRSLLMVEKELKKETEHLLRIEAIMSYRFIEKEYDRFITKYYRSM